MSLHLMGDSMDMDTSPLRPQNYLFGCELKADKDYYHFKVDNVENEQQLSLRTVSLGAGTKDELHIVEAEAMNYEGSPIKVTLATLKILKCGSGPVHISGQHLVAVEKDAESEDEDEEDVKLLSGNKVPQKKVKLDEDDDEDDEDNENDEDDTMMILMMRKLKKNVPVKKSGGDIPAKNAQKSNQNGKDLKPSTPRSRIKSPSKNRK
ncbi:hypothetical protein U0070_011857 [Myodes glareolus]|uniref:Nucleophosmin n=1 Tax=Myodes glareolus TaxID=447135 RepID=A0AAW0K1S2_MYOGA